MSKQQSRASQGRVDSNNGRCIGAVVATSCAAILLAAPLAAQTHQTSPGSESMSMGSMSGGRAPPDARDPNAFSDGFDYGSMPGLEQVDQLPISKILAERLESVTRNGRTGAAWDMQAWYGPDTDKLWIRSEGARVGSKIEDATGAEALWWHAFSPFWATQLGLRQDFGPGAHTYAAFGIQGLAPYWFEVRATGYVGNDGRLEARFLGSYDMLLTNRLILTPSVEAFAYSRNNLRRGIGTGLGSIAVGGRLRYEFSRKFAPYIGYVRDRALGGTARLKRAEGEGDLEENSGFVAGLRIWW